MMKSRVPISFYVWIFISIGLTIGLIIAGMSMIGSLIYGGLGIAIVYLLLNTRDCRIEILDDRIIINYLRPFSNKEILDLSHVYKIEFQKGRYPILFSFQSDVDRYIKTKDKLIIKNQEKEYYVLINTRRKDIRLIINKFNEKNTLANIEQAPRL